MGNCTEEQKKALRPQADTGAEAAASDGTGGASGTIGKKVGEEIIGGDHGAHGGPQIGQVYPHAEAREKADEQFAQMLAAHPDRAILIQKTKANFMQRLEQHGAKEFPAAEVNMLNEMFDMQVKYSRQMFGAVREHRGLEIEERRRIARTLRAGNIDAIASDLSIPADLRAELIRRDKESGGEMIRGHASEEGGVMADFHLAVMESFQRGGRGGRGEGAAGANDDFLAAPPGSHGRYMQEQVGKDPGTWELAAREKLGGGDKAGGLSLLNKAIDMGAGSEALLLRGGILLEKGDYDGAAADARKALELNPGDAGAKFILSATAGRTTPGAGSSHAASGAGASGGSAGAGASGGSGGSAGFKSGEHVMPGMTNASSMASNQKLDEARRAMAMGDVGAAVALAQRALELDPGNAAAHNFLSGVFARSRDYKRAIASARAGLAVSPRDAALLNSKAFAENRAKLYRDALGSANGAIEADARNPYSYANRAYAYGGLADRESMMSDINRAAGIDPRFKQAAADAAALQLPSNADILFMFPGENPEEPAAAPAGRSRSFGVVVGAGLLGGLLLALGLLSTVLAPLKDSVVSAFTKATRRGPSVHALEEASSPEPALAAAAGLIRGQYEILRQIGAGGMGTVYEGTDHSLGRRVAIKKMRDELRVNARERERFVIEARTVASLHHPNIVDIYAIAEEGEDVYLVFEYVDGRTVHDLAQAQGRLNPSDAVRVTRAMGEALAYAHAHGVIHRDVKPSNVMVTGDGRIKVMDFGIARMAKDALTRYSMTGAVAGTPPYMAPEQEQGVVRRESDVYALAICTYEMLTGKLPFIGVAAGMLMNKINMSYIPPSRAIAGLPDSLDEVFLKAFQADPDQRCRTPQEFASALEAAFGEARDRVTPEKEKS